MTRSSREPSFGMEFFASPSPDAQRVDSGPPFRIAVLADFSGSASVEGPIIRSRVDIDTLDEVPSRFQSSITLPSCDDATVPVGSIDDLHPDQLYRQLDVFQTLRRTRSELREPSTFDAAAARVRSWSQEHDHEDAPTPAPTASPTDESNQDTLQRLLGGHSSSSGGAASGPSTVDRFIRKVLADSLDPGPDPSLDALVAVVDRAITGHMRRVLGDPAFRVNEASWRGVELLVRRLELDESLQLDLLDVSRARLEHDLSLNDPRQSSLYDLLVKRTVEAPGATPYTVLVVDQLFDPASADDVRLLSALSRLAAASHTAVLTGCTAAGCQSNAESSGTPFDELRRSPSADRIALAGPRVLARLPYGAETDPLDAFEFEETDLPPDDSAYCWMNAAYLLACSLAQQFAAEGWNMSPGSVRIDELPLHTYTRDGERAMTPCAEVWLSDGEAETLLDLGITPVQAVRGDAAVIMPRVQSIASPPAALRGAWTG